LSGKQKSLFPFQIRLSPSLTHFRSLARTVVSGGCNGDGGCNTDGGSNIDCGSNTDGDSAP
ncbi:hypothetical protein LINPERHAP1_LOCUS18547, partial [Linum perenne]